MWSLGIIYDLHCLVMYTNACAFHYECNGKSIQCFEWIVANESFIQVRFRTQGVRKEATTAVFGETAVV